ncbi:MAG TPA: hypothetical protein HA362_08170 [Nanoarchaeota archaeon]|nr:hypothetical protein [Nanoarchaeota archaeon]
MDKRIIIFSPHCDDAVLSLGGAILNNYLRKNIFVHTIFSVSNYTIIEQCTGHTGKITKLRNEEERRVMRLMGIRYKLWHYPEPSLRKGYKETKDIFNPKSNPEANPLFGELYNAIENVCLQNEKAYLFFPLGLGNHIDHLIIKEIGIKLLAKYHLKIYFYEDQPYAGGEDIKSIEETIGKHYPYLIRFTFKFDNILDKIHILKNYKSQLDAEDSGWVFWHTQRRNGEAVWSDKSNISLLAEESK